MSTQGSQQNHNELLSSESGQATFEYIIVLMVALLFAVNASKMIVAAFDAGALTLGGRLEKSLKTGRAPLSAWRN